VDGFRQLAQRTIHCAFKHLGDFRMHRERRVAFLNQEFDGLVAVAVGFVARAQYGDVHGGPPLRAGASTPEMES